MNTRATSLLIACNGKAFRSGARNTNHPRPPAQRASAADAAAQECGRHYWARISVSSKMKKTPQAWERHTRTARPIKSILRRKIPDYRGAEHGLGWRELVLSFPRKGVGAFGHPSRMASDSAPVGRRPKRKHPSSSPSWVSLQNDSAPLMLPQRRGVAWAWIR
jgi:hypothetical protein